jgi:predicted TIM-barrel fold metal-dependent hydrolase
MKYQFVSGDDHMDGNWLPKELWQSRVPAKFKDDAPKVVDTAAGPTWVFRGETRGGWGPMKVVGMTDAIERAGALESGVLRPSDPKLRIEDMDRDGVDAQVIYSLQSFTSPDAELNRACYTAYNDWLAEFAAHNPERLFPTASLPVADPKAAVAELERAAKAGIRGAEFSIWNAAAPVHDEVWEPLWAAAAEANVPLSFHIGGGLRSVSFTPHRGELATAVAVTPMQLDEPMAAIIFCGALERYPNLRIILAESGLCWVAYLLERMDHSWEKQVKRVSGVTLEILPKDIFKRQMYAGFLEDNVGLKIVEDIGEGNILWSSDYPHPDSTWPHSKQYVEEHIRPTVGDAVTRKITCDNAVSLYHMA